jgi:hypothetical protein
MLVCQPDSPPFALHVADDAIDYREHQFPKEVISIVREGLIEASNHYGFVPIFDPLGSFVRVTHSVLL